MKGKEEIPEKLGIAHGPPAAFVSLMPTENRQEGKNALQLKKKK